MQKSIYSDEYKVLRGWLARKRREKMITQRQLAELLDVSYPVIAKIEMGDRKLEIIEYLSICRILDADPYEGLRIIEEAVKKKL